MPKKLVFKPNKKLSAENIMYFSRWIRQMDAFSGDGFEEFLRDLFICFGYTVNTNAVQLPNGYFGDGGIDLVVQKGGIKTAVQAKAWRLEYDGNVGVEVIRNLAGAIVGQKGKKMGGCVITTNFFTQNALYEAKTNFPHIELICRYKLLHMVSTLNPKIIPEGVEFAFEELNKHMNKCPKCGHVLTGRINKFDERRFLACPKNIDCKHTEAF